MTNLATLRRASTTFTNAIDKVDGIRDQLAEVDALIKELNKHKAQLRETAIDQGLARLKLAQRETAPNRAEYIKLHGLEAWERDHKSTTVRTFDWI